MNDEDFLLPYLTAWCVGSLTGWAAVVALMWPWWEVEW